MGKYTEKLEALNACIWDAAELKFQETRSAAAMCELLRQEGFAVTEGVADMPTCFTATFTNGEGGAR